jgi:peptidoglycan hydrolase CwlO-like protein
LLRRVLDAELADHGGRVTRRAHHAWILIALALALVASLAPAAASAAPDTTEEELVSDGRIKMKKAERKAVLAEIEQMRKGLSNQIATYVALGRRIDRTRKDILEVTLEIDEMDLAVRDAQQALEDRAVQMYRGGRVNLLQVLLRAESVPELMERMSYLVASSRHDARLIAEVRLARQESMWLQEGLQERVDLLSELQGSADQQRSQIESDLALQEEKAVSIGEDIARLMREARESRVVAGSEPEGRFDPDRVISDSVFFDGSSLTLLEIQRFLEQQPGTLKSYRALDHSGEMKSAAEMIFEASAAHGINPKVILAKLQKEQSLLANANPTQRAYDWAMGCGKADSRTYVQYQGFGKQVWFCSVSLKKNAGRWRPGVELKIDGSVVQPSNASTYSLYKYTPHFRGTMSFWMIYWRYFGDPFASRQL